ncbi:MAG: hypothetical protein QM479_17450 [Pseudomonadota bacterium]
MDKQTKLYYFIFICLLLFGQFVSAANQQLDIPDSLQDWQDWILYDRPNIRCPDSTKGKNKLCVWPGRLKIYLNEPQQQIDFYQSVSVYAKSRVFLPGGVTVWPQQVLVNNQAVAVLSYKNRPYIWLVSGQYKLSGQLLWHEHLNYISLSKETILVDLFIADKITAQKELPQLSKSNYSLQKKPTIDAQNRLWLDFSINSTINSHQAINDSVQLQVYRKISDGIPLLMESFYRIKVSGQAREITIKDIIAPSFLIYAYSSQLPARIDKDNSLLVQVKPGSWTFRVIGRATKQLQQIAYFSTQEKLQKESDTSFISQGETWVFKEDLSLQQVNASSKQRIDPSQTTMPAVWKNLPAFYMQANSVLKLTLKKRGNSTPTANDLTLERRLWLDFSGQGMTVEDHIQGEMKRNWRLNFSADVLPGKVSLNNKPQLITYSENKQSGIEVQNGRINLRAESRLENNIQNISATGWKEDFKQLKASLYLPPGWSIFHILGVDEFSSGWINQWTLLDLFQVLLFSIIFYRLWGLSWGLLALLGFILLAHRMEAPIWIWLHILLATGLLRLVKKGRLQKILVFYKNLSIVVLIFILLPFWVNEIRSAIYPQLKISSYQLEKNQSNIRAGRASQFIDAELEADIMPEAVVIESNYKSIKKRVTNALPMARGSYLNSIAKPSPGSISKQGKKLDQYNANAKIQTGPGLPGWAFNQIKLSWSGPVTQQQRIQFYFISPFMNLILSIFMLFLSVALVYRVVDASKISATLFNFLKQTKAEKLTTLLAFILIVSFTATGFWPGVSMASEIDTRQINSNEKSYPPAYLLSELKKRLSKAALCQPDCASIEKMHISLSQQQLQMRLIVNAGTLMAIPLPLNEKLLTIKHVIANGVAINQYLKNNKSEPRLFFLPLKEGKHQVVIEAMVHGNSLVLPLNIATHNITYDLDNWTINGLKNSQPISRQLLLQKTLSKKEGTLEQPSENSAVSGLKQPKSLAEKNIVTAVKPVFVKIRRQFYFGLDWTIETTVSRLSDKSSQHSAALVFDYPLLAGESVISANKKIKDNNINISLAPSQNYFSWSSRLKKTARLTLLAKNNPHWIEQWEIDSNSIWHIEHQGIPPIQHINNSKRHQPIWRPWPGEVVKLSIIRPEAIAGKLRTITLSKRKSTYASKISEHQLQLSFNSSQGGPQQIILPDDVQVLSLSVANKQLAIDEKNNILEFSLAAGMQKVIIKWRENQPLSNMMSSSLVNIGLESVNAHQSIHLPNDRWVIYTSGPEVGPVVLFWGMLLVILVVAYVVSKIPGIPLSAIHALLLAIGLAPVSLWSLLIVLLWFVFMLRRKQAADLFPFLFNSMQLGLILFSFSTLFLFIYTIKLGLLGYPDMHILGNGSSANLLNWYQDRTDELLPQATFISLPIYVYRILMLLWALWLAFASISWAMWAWQNFSSGGYWKKIHWKRKKIKDIADK